MIKWLSSFIGRIVGRIKVYKSTILIGLASILIPVSAYLLVEGVEAGKLWALLTFIFGIISLISAVVYAKSDETKEEEKYKEQLELTKETSEKLISELKRLRQEMKLLLGGRNERKRKSK